ncbi:hydroxyethylthiazole kinase [Brachybacterium sp. SW0106-09]|uniref:hydroxyethylthiazole kinase n=1 Tax=Brachybacterium sp. SW0106-09 TaxID=1704590 RepID=UPI0006B49FBA|nr:hydroxyethylthiazole kinase [Brachybacterium sp. SW0106-09]GAP80211.1 hydroxyethylthiazole kinase [Brachybacterium sp. SW0106-09]
MSPADDPDLARALPVLAAVREAAPLVHCLTATVSMQLVADGLLAAGARPMMTETVVEAPVVTTVADALLINLGTLSTDAMDGIPATVAVAREQQRPWVLDPTAIGIAPVRTPLARRLLAQRPTAVRGNASEILALVGEAGGGRGADSTAAAESAAGAAAEVARRTGGAVAVSGAVDLVLDGSREARLTRGSALLPRVTGTGCLLGALTAACTAVWEDPFEAALAATTWMALAGERAASRATGPGSFRMHLLDALDEIGRRP